jgi:hypothetical protein
MDKVTPGDYPSADEGPDKALRTLDALHLATFLIARGRIEGLQVRTADQRLEDAANSA